MSRVEQARNKISSLQTRCFVVDSLYNHYEFHGAKFCIHERGTCVDVKGNFRSTSFVDSLFSFGLVQEEEGSMVTNLVFMLSRVF